MKCDKCGNEFFTGTVCPNCGTPVAMDSDGATVAFDQEIGTSIPEAAEQKPVENQAAEQADSAVFSQNTPQPEDAIYTGAAANPYGNQANMYGNQANMYGNQSNNLYGNQNNMYGNQPNNAYGNQNNMYGNQNNNPYGNQNNMYGNQPNNLYGGQNFQPGAPNNYTLKPEEPKKSKTPFIIAAVCLAAAVIALVLILVFVVLKKDDGKKDDEKKDIPTSEERTSETINAPDTEKPNAEDTEAPSDTEAAATDTPISGGTLEGTVVYNDNSMQLTVVSAEYKYGMLEVTGQVENKTGTDARLSDQGIALNGVSLNGYMTGDVLAGSKAEWTLSVYSMDMEIAGIEQIDEITAYFELYDSETYDTVALGNFTYDCDFKTDVTPKYDLSKFEDVYEDENCDVKAYKDIVKVEDAYYTVLRVKSKMDVPTSVMLNDTKINGVVVEENGGWDDMVPGSVVYAEVYWYEDDLTEDCMSFEDIEMGFDFFDFDTWDDYSITTISYKTDGVK